MPSLNPLMTHFLRVALIIATCVDYSPAFGQNKPSHSAFWGLYGGAGLVFSPASPQRVELPPSYLAATGSIGETAALGALVRVPRGRWFGQAELRYQNVSSADFTYSRGVSTGFFSFSTNTTNFHAQQLALAALSGYTFGSRQQLYGLLGPTLAVRLNTNGNVPPSVSSLSDEVRYAVDNAPAATQLQLHGGLGWWGKHLGVEARYTHGLTPLVRRIVFDNETHEYRVGANTFMFTVGYHGQFGRRGSDVR